MLIQFKSQKLPAMVLCLGEPLRRFLFSFLIFILLSFHFCISRLLSFLGYFSMSPALHCGFSGPWRLPPALNYNLGYFWLSLLLHLLRTLRFWVSVYYPPAFFTLRSFTNIFDSTCVYQGFPRSQQIFLEVCRASLLIFETQTWPICLCESQ